MNLKTILDFIKSLFSKKVPEPEPKAEATKPKEKQKKKVQVPIQEKTEEKKLEEKKSDKYQQLIANLENPETRQRIIQDKKDREFKVLASNDEEDLIIASFDNQKFIFDKEGLDVFNEEFNVKGFTLCVIGGYLGRVDSEGKEEFFHRFFLKKEIEDFYLNKKAECGLNRQDVVVHHSNTTPWWNKRDNLVVMTKEEHDILHNRITR